MLKRRLLLLLLSLLIWQTSYAAYVEQLPKPVINNFMSLDQAINTRRSVRKLQDKTIPIKEISQLLWATQGITDPLHGLRATPSAGALYPLTIFLVAKDGVWQYIPDAHIIKLLNPDDKRADLAKAAANQDAISSAFMSAVITANYKRTTTKYQSRGISYVNFEAGHAAQNLLLEAVSLGLAAVPIGAFKDYEVSKVLQLPRNLDPLYIIPIGYNSNEQNNLPTASTAVS